MRDVVMCILASFALIVSQMLFPGISFSAVITVVNLDGPDEGFNDPSAPDSASTTGGNNGATLGAQRQIAFQHAANIWGARLSSAVEIRITASLNPLTCTASSATLGSAGATNVFRDFVGAALANTWYSQALANSLFAGDLSPGTSDVSAQFNSAIGTTCPFPLVWYYGLDQNPPAGTLDFVSVLLHELGHGLGFQSFVDLASGVKLGAPGPVFDDVYSRNLEDHSTGKLYSQMTDAERVTASQNNGNLHWVGANMIAASSTLTGGVQLSGHVQMYAPTPQEAGSSVSHFDTTVTPNELMEPFYTGANHDVGLTLELFADLGWTIALPVFTDVDFDGDVKSDVVVYETSSGNWFGLLSADGFAQQLNFGGPNFLPVPGDYDGDGVVDTAVYESTTGNWFIDQTTAGFRIHPNFGGSGFIPVAGDYDGDGKTDLAVYQTSTGHWFLVRSTAGFGQHLAFGGPGFVPVPADYDGDGKVDTAVYQSTTGNWFIAQTMAGFRNHPSFGGSDFISVPGDYDGDEKADVAVYQLSTGHWFFVGSTSGFGQHLSFGGSGFVPVPADYDGDRKTDTAVYEMSTGNWFISQSTAGFRIQPSFGGPGFVPVLPQGTILRALGAL
ncbi:MAG: FG-GAP-like repeat-containing protein [Candidatus Binatia bacterium]